MMDKKIILGYINLCSRSPLSFGKDGAAAPKPYLSAEELPDFDGSRPRTQL